MWASKIWAASDTEHKQGWLEAKGHILSHLIMRSPQVGWGAGAPGPLLYDALGSIYWLQMFQVSLADTVRGIKVASSALSFLGIR